MRTRPLILLILAVYIFSPTLFTWMVQPHGAWYRPFLIWLAVIVVAFLFQTRSKSHDF